MVNGEQLTRRSQTNVANIKLWPEVRVNDPHNLLFLVSPNLLVFLSVYALDFAV